MTTHPLVLAAPGALMAVALIVAVAALRGPARPPVPLRLRAARWWHAAQAHALVARGVLALGAGLAVWLATGWPVAAAATAVGVLVVPALLARHDAHAAIAKLDALSTWVRRLVDALASGAGGLESAIASAARTPPEPIADQVSALAVRIRTRGREPALRLFADELADPAADEVVAALILRSRAGGHGLVDVLEAKAEALATEAAARRDVEADRAKPRTDARLVIMITASVLAGLVLFADEFLAPFGTVLGQLVMTAIVVLMGAAVWWMHLLSRAQRNPRLFDAREGREAP